MVPGHDTNDSIRPKLIGLLPRLRRFAAVLAGDRATCDVLLRTACEHMLAEQHRYQRGMPFDRWAFTQLYALWLEALRQHIAPMTQARADQTLFRDAFAGADGDAAEIAATATHLAALPPHLRAVALLTYGEGFSYDEAAEILDAPPHTVLERTARMLAALIERAGLVEGAVAGAGAQVEPLYPQHRQTGT